MKYTSVEQALNQLRAQERKRAAYNHALGLLTLDAATTAPKGSAQGRGQTMGILSEVVYGMLTDPENGALLAYLEENRDALDAQANREVELARREFDQICKIPADEYVAYTVLVNDAQAIWEQAKRDNDFASFAPALEQIVAFNRKFAGYYHPELAPYDALLNEYEEGLTVQALDAFFARLREALVPLIAKVQAAEPIDDSFLYRHYPVEQQRKLSDYVMEVLGLDRAYCGIGETEHPFTINFNRKDVRITTHYYENNLASSLYSVIHEGGHAIYELGGDEQYEYSYVSGGASMGIHESQSRFFENLIGRSHAFITFLFPKLVELFPQQLADVTAEDFYRAVNKAEPSLIRTGADELTYCMHIMVRCEIEKRLIAGTLSVADVPAEWNRLYREYLGVEVPDDARGCLQDTHWSGGALGYFPSYALGGAYGAQMLSVMEADIGPVWEQVAKGDLSAVKGWLGEHIHRHSSMYAPGKLLEMACGAFDPEYYIRYLTDKYTKLYRL